MVVLFTRRFPLGWKFQFIDMMVKIPALQMYTKSTEYFVQKKSKESYQNIIV